MSPSVVYSDMDSPERKKLKSSFGIAAAATGLLWLIHVVFWVFHINKLPFMVIPGDTRGLLGILTSPLFHDGKFHLSMNSGPFFMFMLGLFYFYRKVAVRALIGMWVTTGIWVWILAPHEPTLGVSGVLYGLGAFLFFSGVFRRDYRSVVIALVVAVIYGSMIQGLFPGERGVSWESHLFGAIAGMAMAFYFRKVDVPAPKRYSWQEEPDEAVHDENAEWNYRKNWPGAQNFYTPNEPHNNDLSQGS